MMYDEYSEMDEGVIPDEESGVYEEEEKDTY